MFGPMAKWVAQIDRADRIPEYVARAFTTACAGRPGPGRARAAGGHARGARPTSPDAPPFHVVQPHPGAEDIDELRDAARSAPSGRSRSSAAAAGRRGVARDMRGVPRGERAAGRRGVPPPGLARQRLAELRRRRRHRHQPEARGARPRRRPAARRRAAARRDDDVRLHAARRAAPKQTLVHVHPGAEELGRVYQADAADPLGHGAVRRGRARPARRAALARVDARRRAPTTRRGSSTSRCRATLDLGDVHRAPARARARTRSSRTAPATSPSGCTASGASTTTRRQLAPTSGAMGYGVPAAVAAKARRARSARSSASPATATS